ncbi:MAG: phytoene/squalene synthase family protein [Acidobacteria bacterium]|nr:phytoene/squalene synthase family protein [Acidobacteriota bacterium]
MSAGVQPATTRFAPTPSQLVIAYSVCRSITRAAARNFYYAFLVLPRSKREALCAVYAFMRRCDDIADDTTVPVCDRRTKLADWLDGLHHAIEGMPSDDPVLLALGDAQRHYRIPIDLLDQLAAGTAMDLEFEGEEEDEPGFARCAPVVRYRTFDDLSQYCYRVASVVGLVCIKIFGYRDPGAEVLAERCGLAFQLTNIIRDVKEDAAMGRVYLPLADMNQFGVTIDDISPRANLKRLQPLLAREAERAREFYRSGAELLPLVNEDSQAALWVLITIYRRLLEKIAAQGYNVFGEKINLTVREKFSVLAQGFVKRLT